MRNDSTSSIYARLRDSLVQEVFQTERSAQLHCAREANRLGDSPPAAAMRACAFDAERAREELTAIARELHLPNGGPGSLIGRMLSSVRERVVDRVIDEERSYRGTLLGLRHGVDVVRMLQHIADATGQVDLGGFCARWLTVREPLVAEVETCMRWFASHPSVAIAHPGKVAAIS
jgi:hypothetical protein